MRARYSEIWPTVFGVSSPYDPQQPDHQPYQPGYPPPGYPPPGYPPAGYQQWSPSEQPRRPGVLIAAGMLWLLNGGLLLVFGALIALATRLPGFEEAMRERGAKISHDELMTAGVSGAVFGVVIIGLAVAVFSGAIWARILIMVVAVVPNILLLASIVFPVSFVAASVLQFLPPVTRYVQAKRRQSSVT
jgi:hypothetical protein